MTTSYSPVIEKLTAAQLIKKFSACYGTQRFLPVFSVLSHMNVTHNT
jgi:hypothetical protein